MPPWELPERCCTRRLLVGAVSLGLFSCGGTPHIGEPPPFEGSATPVDVEVGCGEDESDSITVHGVALREQTLHVDVTHGGGCAEHDYRICAAREVLRTDPGQWVFTVVHDAHGDECDAEHSRSLRASLEHTRQAVGLRNLQGRSFTVLVE